MVRIENKTGNVIISSEAFGEIVGLAATSCYGVVGMANKSATEGIVSLLKKENYEKGVKVTFCENLLEIDLHIVVLYGVNIPAIIESIVHKVQYCVEDLTGFAVSRVTVFVDDMKF
ncbi:MAG: Asp23/Gls24 family envelope stress response protein [Bacillota bacterium]|nr:Asp23/Gls24 family envelope stress response protein [Bacillota bacterium]